MEVWSDIFIAAKIPADVLRKAFASAFNTTYDRVVLAPIGAVIPDADVVLETIGSGYLPGDYPLQVLPSGPDGSTNDPGVLQKVAIALGVPIIAGYGTDQEGMALYLPNGSMHPISVRQDDDNGIRNTVLMRRLIATGKTARTRARVA
jgi:hypothetical protein